MPIITVADTSTLIKASKAGVIDCLGGLFSKIYIPNAVKNECMDGQISKQIQSPIFEVKTVQNILPLGMGKGEREAISLAIELNIKKILIDDLKGFKKAQQRNLMPLTIKEVLILAKRSRLIDSVKLAFDQMKNAGEGVTDAIYRDALRLAGEL